MTLYDGLLFVHILAAITWIGGGLLLSLLGLRARRSEAAAGVFADLLPVAGLRLFMPAVVLIPVTGVWMVLADSEWSFRQTWVKIALGLFAAAFLLGAIYLSRLGMAIGRGAGPGTDRAALPALINRWLAAYVVVLLVLLLAVADMVFKPGAA